MASGRLSTILQHLHCLGSAAQAGELTDAELLERFAAKQEQGAFAALLKRHGPMVLSVCRRVLGNAHDAEDAFQATFLVLVRKAGSIRRREALGGWLHEVALRVAMRARASATSRRRHEQRVPEMPRKDFLATVVWRDLQPVLDEEVQGLPESCREAFVLCYLEGKTYEEAAQQLHCRAGTISRRLARARELLRARLSRRGLVLPAGVLAAALSNKTAPAAVPAPLIASTVKAALACAAGTAAVAGVISAHVAALAEGGLKAMATTKAKLALVLLLAGGLALAGAAALAHPAGPADLPAPAADPQPAQQPADPAQVESVISGQVADADGKPVAGAHVAVLARHKTGARARFESTPPQALAEGKTDAGGKFRLAVRGFSSERYWGAFLLTRAEGHGQGYDLVPLEQRAAEVKVRLPRERVLHGRLVDLQGLPAAGVKVELTTLEGKLPAGNTMYLNFEGAPAGARYWPAAVVSDAQGRFTLRGLPADWHATVFAHGEGFARQSLKVEVAADARQGTTLALAPARVLEGAVTYRDTGKPVAGARLRIYTQPERYAYQGLHQMETRADAKGQYRVVTHEGNFLTVIAYPPAGEPYLLVNREVTWPNASVIRHEVNLALRRGVLVKGTVTEAASGKPVPGATVEFNPRYSNNPFYTREIEPMFSDARPVLRVGADGKFQLAALPGPGHLLINGPTPDYVHKEILTRDLRGPDVRPNRRHYPDGLVALNLKPEDPPQQVQVRLQRGVTLQGRVVGPDGKPVPSGVLFCRTYVPAGYSLNPVASLGVKDGRFRLPGWDPARAEPVYFLSPELGVGGIARLDPKRAADKDLTVKLQKCGAAKARFVDEEGKPLTDLQISVEIPISSGASFFDRDALVKAEVTADAAWLGNLDHKQHNRLRTDAEGRLVLPGLLPGARHRLIVTRPNGPGMFRLPVEVTAESGKTLDLKDITVNLK
jgi:RNA polymerase sigma factor (sigma-70 family)